jgi:hypothetical protein
MYPANKKKSLLGQHAAANNAALEKQGLHIVS